jgi:hypothetical protein
MNIQRFRQVLAYIEAHPEEWDQSRDTHEAWARPLPHCFGCIAAKLFGVDSKEFSFADDRMVVALECSQEIASWLYNPERTLDDFRTVARRVYA